MCLFFFLKRPLPPPPKSEDLQASQDPATIPRVSAVCLSLSLAPSTQEMHGPHLGPWGPGLTLQEPSAHGCGDCGWWWVVPRPVLTETSRLQGQAELPRHSYVCLSPMGPPVRPRPQPQGTPARAPRGACAKAASPGPGRSQGPCLAPVTTSTKASCSPGLLPLHQTQRSFPNFPETH